MRFHPLALPQERGRREVPDCWEGLLVSTEEGLPQDARPSVFFMSRCLQDLCLGFANLALICTTQISCTNHDIVMHVTHHNDEPYSLA